MDSLWFEDEGAAIYLETKNFFSNQCACRLLNFCSFLRFFIDARCALCHDS